ncbi:MAG TPA: GNAT family N-acetyltransferase [Jiangellales bacterium]|nr:GNAT family N-acetyltransferase [Jiangellales bacterium]
MKISVVRPAELGAAELDSWRLMQKQNVAIQSPFLSPEFTLAVGRARTSARVAVIEDGGDIVGFFPHELRGRSVGTAIGAGICDCQGVVHAPGARWDARELIRACRLPVWEFDHLVAGQGSFAPYTTAVHASPIIDLSGGYPAYLNERVSATGGIRTIQRKLRKLEREVGPIRFEFDHADPAELRTMMAWKSAQYRRTVQRDMFGMPWVVDVVTELFHAGTAECTGTLSLLYAGDRAVASHFGIRSHTILAYWFPAYDVAFSQYSPGLALILLMAESAAAQGVCHVDLGRGQARYKDELKSGELPVAEGRVESSRLVGAARRTQSALTSRARRVRVLRPLRHLRRLRR